MRYRNALLILFLAGLFATAFLAACSSSTAAPTSAPGPTESPQALLQERCTSCHSLERVQSAAKTQAEWETTLRRMVDRGARLNDAEFATLLAYLAATYK